MSPVWRIPPITSPLGRHWGQPADLHKRVKLFPDRAEISRADWWALPKYDNSYPSGVYAGKVWRRRGMLCWYGPDEGRTRVAIGHLPARVIEDAPLRLLPAGEFLGDLDSDAWESILSARGGCRCFVSPPCGACSNPLTEGELNSVGFTHGGGA